MKRSSSCKLDCKIRRIFISTFAILFEFIQVIRIEALLK